MVVPCSGKLISKENVSLCSLVASELLWLKENFQISCYSQLDFSCWKEKALNLRHLVFVIMLLNSPFLR